MGCQCSNQDGILDINSNPNESFTDVILKQAKEYPILMYSQLYCNDSRQCKELLNKYKFDFELENMPDNEDDTLQLGNIQSL